MATRILTVEDVFDIKGRGLVVVPGPLVDANAAPRLLFGPMSQAGAASAA